ncbi:MAG: ElyC/SanA/YdcF family protein [Cyanobacteria bacterium P01_D01_bin.36]
MLVLLTRILLWASVGLLIWYVLTKIIDQKYLTWLGGVILVLLLVASFAAPDDNTIQVIWRILSFPLTPLGAAIVFLGASLSDGVKSIKGTPAAIALGILIFFSIPLSAQWLVSDAESAVRTAYEERAAVCGEVCRADELPQQGDLGEAAAIVVFGDRNDIDKALSVSDTNNADDVSINTALAPRLIYAANLYQQARARGAAPFVIVTAGTGNAESEQQRIIRSILAVNNVASADIRVENTGFNIRETGQDVEDLLVEQEIIASADDRRAAGATIDDPRVVIVAPAIVMSRAALAFERMNLQVVAKPTDFYTARFNTDGQLLGRLPDLLPSVDALQITTRYWNELLTSLYYFLRGWLPNFNFGWNSTIEI